MLDRFIKFISSLKLTVACLILAVVLVFIGTIAQVGEGLYQAQARYFKSMFIFWSPVAGFKIPVFPGGYLLGSVLVVNLVAAHLRRFRLAFDKLGIHFIHGGLILLLVGQLATDMFSSESAMWLRKGETKNYSEDFQANELVIVDRTDPARDTVHAIPESRLAAGKELRDSRLPFVVRVQQYWPNSFLTNGPLPGASVSGASQGLLKDVRIMPLPKTSRMEERNVPSAAVELLAPGDASLGSWLVSSHVGAEQLFTHSNRTYNVAMRFLRHYKPFSLTLLEFTHERYMGTDIPKHFASRVRLENPVANENRETTIFMNNPLRYGGATYYQASLTPDDSATMLQVVRNPGWLTPYLSCVLVALGLTVQFSIHLLKFVKRRTA